MLEFRHKWNINQMSFNYIIGIEYSYNPRHDDSSLVKKIFKHDDTRRIKCNGETEICTLNNHGML
jgi:hypothetical protein